MTLEQLKKDLLSSISNLYAEREAHQIVRIYLEDLLTNLKSDDELTDAQVHEYAMHKEKFLALEPIQYITGLAYFFDMLFKVNSHVLIPRPETEELVREVIAYAASHQVDSILDIGTGSGCIACCLKKHIPRAEVIAIDKSRGALEVARENAKGNQLEIKFTLNDFLLDENSIDSRFDIIVSNPPYISKEEKDRMNTTVLKYEPTMALFPDSIDPNIFYKKILAFSKTNLKPEGAVFAELNEFNALDVLAYYRADGYFTQVDILDDMQGKKRMLRATR